MITSNRESNAFNDADRSARPVTLAAPDILESPSDPRFDRLTFLAAHICDTPFAMVLLRDRNQVRCESQLGLALTEISRSPALCLRVMSQLGKLIFENVAEDEWCMNDTPTNGEPTIRFFGGFPLVNPHGDELGKLCVFDRISRRLNPAHWECVEALAGQIVTLLESDRQIDELERAKAIDERTIAALQTNEARFRAFMDESPAAAFMKDSEGRYIYVNAPCVRQFQKPVEMWLGNTDFELWPEHAEAIRAKDRAVMLGSTTEKFVERHPTPANPASVWQTYKFPFTDENGTRYLAGIALDISYETESEDALRRSEEKYRSVIEHLAESFFLFDLETKAVVESNLAFRQLLGYDADEAERLNLFDFVILDQKTVADEIEQVLRARRFHLGYRQCRRKDGSLIDVDVSVSVVNSSARTLLAVVLRDVSERCEYDRRLTEYQRELEGRNGQLQQLATTDRLTGIKNYAAFQDRLCEEFDRAKRYSVPLSVLLIDADHFKTYNDAFGHPAGDEALREIARILVKAVRTTDLVARYGGEEFAILMPHSGEAGAIALAERCRRSMAECSSNRRVITLSIGISSVTVATTTGADFLQQADRALYHSKHLGRNRVTHVKQIESQPN